MAREQLIIVQNARQMGKMIEWVKRLRPEVKIQVTQCQQQRNKLLDACKRHKQTVVISEGNTVWEANFGYIEAAIAEANKGEV